MGAFRFGLLAVGMLLSACTQQISSDVTRFNQLTMPPQGESVAVIARDKIMEKSMEFAQYAGLVQQRLTALGFRQPENGQLPDIMAELDYGVSSGPSGLRDGNHSPVSVGVGVAGGSGGWHSSGVGVGVSTGFNLGGDDDAGASYSRRLSLVLTRTKDNVRLFEGRVVSVGDTPDLNRVMPYLVDALFTDFPGRNGETRTIKKPVSNPR